MRLFNRQGAHATGIDQIIAESGVAKRTFYRYFPSKVQLLVEYFRERDDIWYSRLNRFIDSKSEPIDRLLSLFDSLKEWFAEPDFFGCPFIRGLSDFGPESGSPELSRCIAEHFARTEALVESLLVEIRPKNAQKFVPQIMSLIAGATIIAHASHDASIADVNKAMARKLLTE